MSVEQLPYPAISARRGLVAGLARLGAEDHPFHRSLGGHPIIRQAFAKVDKHLPKSTSICQYRGLITSAPCADHVGKNKTQQDTATSRWKPVPRQLHVRSVSCDRISDHSTAINYPRSIRQVRLAPTFHQQRFSCLWVRCGTNSSAPLSLRSLLVQLYTISGPRVSARNRSNNQSINSINHSISLHA